MVFITNYRKLYINGSNINSRQTNNGNVIAIPTTNFQLLVVWRGCCALMLCHLAMACLSGTTWCAIRSVTRHSTSQDDFEALRGVKLSTVELTSRGLPRG